MKATGRNQSVRVSSELTPPHRGRSTDRSTGEQHLPVNRPDRPAGRARKGGAAQKEESNNYGPNVFTNQSATKDLNLVVEPNILSEFTQIFEQDFLNLNSLTGINFIKSLGVSEA